MENSSAFGAIFMLFFRFTIIPAMY